MGQKWSKIRRRCSSFNTGTGKTADDRHRGRRGDGQERGPLIPSSPDDSTATSSAPSSPAPPTTPTAAAAVQDLLRARLNIGNKHRQQQQQQQHRQQQQQQPVQQQGRNRDAQATSTFYVPSPLLRTAAAADGYGDAGPCSLPAAFDVMPTVTAAATAAADHQPHHPLHHRLQQPTSLCRVAETPSSCGSSGRGTADDCAGSDRSSVSYSDHGYNSIASAATGYADVDR